MKCVLALGDLSRLEEISTLGNFRQIASQPALCKRVSFQLLDSINVSVMHIDMRCVTLATLQRLGFCLDYSYHDIKPNVPVAPFDPMVGLDSQSYDRESVENEFKFLPSHHAQLMFFESVL
jgi:hypothetical protein